MHQATTVIKPLDKVTRRSYTFVIYEELHELIQELVLRPGERLIEADLAAQFGVSKTPVREALLRLESDGLVTIVTHSGATVSWLSIEDFEQQLFLQDALEQPALPLVVKRITVSELNALGQLIEEIRALHAQGDESRYHHLVRRVHRELFAAARYPRLSAWIGTVMQSMRRYHPIFVRPFAETWNLDLEIITQRFEHVRAKDPSGAAAAVQRGHAATLEFAWRRVEARDPAVMAYLARSQDRGRSFLTSVHDRSMNGRQRHSRHAHLE